MSPVRPEDLEREGPELRLLPTQTRTVTTILDGVPVDVPVHHAGDALYPSGTGPFTTNRAARRRQKRNR